MVGILHVRHYPADVLLVLARAFGCLIAPQRARLRSDYALEMKSSHIMHLGHPLLAASVQTYNSSSVHLTDHLVCPPARGLLDLALPRLVLVRPFLAPLHLLYQVAVGHRMLLRARAKSNIRHTGAYFFFFFSSNFRCHFVWYDLECRCGGLRRRPGPRSPPVHRY